MSAIRTTTYCLSAAILIALIGFGASQVSTKPIGVTTAPIMAGTIVPATVRAERVAVNEVLDTMPVTGDDSAGGMLSENAYDFNNPDSIPGFGTLPHDYNAAPVMPRFGSQ